jgi:hypothetical protein
VVAVVAVVAVVVGAVAGGAAVGAAAAVAIGGAVGAAVATVVAATAGGGAVGRRGMMTWMSSPTWRATTAVAKLPTCLRSARSLIDRRRGSAPRTSTRRIVRSS